MTYTLTYGNNGSAPGNNIAISDVLPATLNYMAGSASEGGTFTPATNTLNWSLGTLAVNGNGQVTFKATVAATAAAGSTISNTASISASGATTVQSSAANVTVVAASAPILTLTKSVSPTISAPGGVVTYTLAYENTGGSATNVVLTDVLPTNMTYVANSASLNGSYAAASTTLSWTLGTLPANGTGQVTFQATVAATAAVGSTINNTATISATGATALTSNTATLTINAVILPILTLTKSVSPASAGLGSVVTYTLAYDNTGGTATNVVLSDTLPSNVTYVANSAGENATYDDNTDTLSWSLGTLPTGNSGQVTFQMTVVTTDVVGSTISNTASISAAEAPTPVTSNSVSFTVTAGPPAKLVFQVQPPKSTNATAMMTPAVIVQVQDAYGNTVASATTPITLALAANPGGSTLGGTVTVNAVNGVATFSTLTLNKAGTGYTLSASAAGLAGATSNTFTITSGPPAQLVFATYPNTSVVGTVITPAVTVQVLDAGSNPVPATIAITLALGENPGGGTLGGTVTETSVGGVATFSDPNINRAGIGYTLTANSPSMIETISRPFTIISATPVLTLEEIRVDRRRRAGRQRDVYPRLLQYRHGDGDECDAHRSAAG